ncbi:MAG: nitrous oxide reductase family maturation protein NosD [Saprospiraceae bacterium]|nr:nitrous oxide reductase family maturation protein NosD [Saprospiraceae bacterium]
MYKKLNLFVLLLMTFLELSGNSLKMQSDADTLYLQKLINKAKPFDTILISPGLYETVPVIIDKSLTIIGQPNSHLHSLHGDQILVATHDSVQIIGLTLSGVKTNYLKETSAIRIVKSKHFKIMNNTIENCFFGIYLEHAKYGIIRNNQVSGKATTEAGSGNAIHAWYCSHLKIEDNKLQGHRDGIYFEFVSDSEIMGNRSWRNKRYGLHFMFSNTDKYHHNIFSENGAGVAVMFSKEIEMIDNQFSFNWGNSSYGLLLKEINDALVLQNKFENNTIGIFVEGSNRIKYQYNDFRDNGWGIKFSGGCSANEIRQNNFLNNSLDLVVNTALNDNKIESNYWSEYTGYDLDRNNIGDVPHYPVKLFSYVLDQVPEAIVLMRSFFVDLLNFSEKVSPVFTPKEVYDPKPLMHPIS